MWLKVTHIILNFYIFQVHIVGFGPTKNGNWDHYWEPPINDDKVDAFRRTGVHSGDKESEIWQQLEREGKVKIYLGSRSWYNLNDTFLEFL